MYQLNTRIDSRKLCRSYLLSVVSVYTVFYSRFFKNQKLIALKMLIDTLSSLLKKKPLFPTNKVGRWKFLVIVFNPLEKNNFKISISPMLQN